LSAFFALGRDCGVKRTDRRDLEAALGYLLDSRAIEGPTWRLSSFVELAEAGQFRLTAQGQEWLDGGPTG